MRTPNFDRDTFHDNVVARGKGAPTQDGYRLGARIIREWPGAYALAASEVVYQGMTTGMERTLDHAC